MDWSCKEAESLPGSVPSFLAKTDLERLLKIYRTDTFIGLSNKAYLVFRIATKLSGHNDIGELNNVGMCNRVARGAFFLESPWK